MPASNERRGQTRGAETKLKNDLRSKLHRPRVANTRHGPEVGSRHIRAQHAEIHIVENVECLGAELKAEILAEPNVLDRGQVKTDRWRPGDIAAGHVSRNIRNEDTIPRRIDKCGIR